MHNVIHYNIHNVLRKIIVAVIYGFHVIINPINIKGDIKTMRLFYKKNDIEHYIDVPNKDVEIVETIFNVYNKMSEYVYNQPDRVKIIRKEFNIFNYGKEEN